MKSLEEIYIANGQSLRPANRTGKLEYDDRFGCMVWTPAQFLVEPEAESDCIHHGKATKTTEK